MDTIESKLLTELLLDVKKDMSDMKQDVSGMKKDLSEHMRRSEASEARLDVQEEKLDTFIISMEPVKEHVKTVHLITRGSLKILKALALLASVVGTVAGLLKLR